MKAAQLTAPKKWDLVEVEKPQAREGYILVRMEYVGLCGSDRPFFEGVASAYPLDPGDTGHEALGIVESCPSGRFQPGQRVLIWGHDRGLFQEFVLAQEGLCVGMPAEGEPEIMLMSQLLGTVIHCMLKLGNVIGKKVVVMGQGAVGQLFDATLRNLGAQQIIAIDPQAHRLETARLMGATHTIDANHEDVKSVVAEITDGDLAEIVTSVGPNPHHDFVIAHQWIREGRIDVRPIVTHVMPFKQIQQGFETAYECPEEHAAVKVVLKF